MAKKKKECTGCIHILVDGSLRHAKCRALQNIDKAKMKALKIVGMEDPPNEYRYDYVSIQRSAGWLWARIDNHCGKEGRWYTPKKEEENESSNDIF